TNWSASGIALQPGFNTITMRAFDAASNVSIASIVVNYVRAVDFDGDGRSDIAWQNTDGSTAMWLMNGVSLSSGGGLLGPGTGWNVKAIGDFNGDGKNDIAWQHIDGSCAFWLMNGLSLSNGTVV